MTGESMTEWNVWSVDRRDGSAQAVASGTRPEAEASAAERNRNACKVMTGGDIAFVALPPGRVPSLADLPPKQAQVYPRRWHESIRLVVPSGHPGAQELHFMPAEGPRLPVIVAVTDWDLDELRKEISRNPQENDRALRAVAGLAAFLDAAPEVQDEVWRNLSAERRHLFRDFVNSGRRRPADPAKF